MNKWQVALSLSLLVYSAAQGGLAQESDQPDPKGPAYRENVLDFNPSRPIIVKSDSPSLKNPNGFIEIGALYHGVSQGQGDWYGVEKSAVLQFDESNIWNTRIQYQRRFHDTGVNGVFGNTHIFNEDWYSRVEVSGGASGFFFPSYRLDAFLHRKFLENRNLVAYAGLTAIKSKDFHHDNLLTLGFIHYFEAPWIVEGGIRFNVSDPGSIDSHTQFGAVTYGRSGNWLLTGRMEAGESAYRAFENSEETVEFNTLESSLELRYWLNEKWGFTARAEGYDSELYNRAGGSFSVFREF